MPLVSSDTDNQYANNYRNNELLAAAFQKLEPAISPKTRSVLEPDYFEKFNRSQYQNACIYVVYRHDKKHYLLANLNAPRGIKDLSANSNLMTPGGRRDLDHGLLFTALKEMEEEAGLSSDFLNAHHPDAVVAYLDAVIIPSKRGGKSFKSQLHRYMIDLGALSQDQITSLHQQIKPGDDVAYAEFIDVTALKQDDVHTVAVQLQGTDRKLPLLPGVCQLAKNIIGPKDAILATTKFRDCFKTLSAEFEQLKTACLLESFHLEKEAEMQNKIAFCLLQITAVKDLQKIASAGTTLGMTANSILKSYCNLSVDTFKLINTKYDRLKSEKGAKSSTAESKHCREAIGTYLDDANRFIVAQEYWLLHRDKDYAQMLAVGTRKLVQPAAQNQDDDDNDFVYIATSPSQ